MSISPIAEAIKIPDDKASLLSALMRLSAKAPIDMITRLALKDAEFCERILDILFQNRRPSSITEAIIHDSVRSLGLERVRCLFICHSISSAFSSVRLENFDVGYFWTSCFRRAFAAFAIAEKIDYPDPYEAFLAGFLSDIGTLLLGARFPNLCVHFKNTRSRPAELRAHIEKILTGVSHDEEVEHSGITKLIPPRVIQAIVNHLKPYYEDDRQSHLTCIVSVSVAVADIAQASPKEYTLNFAERTLSLFPQTLDLNEIFTSSEIRANTLSKDLGYEIPAPLSFDSILTPASVVMAHVDDPYANLFQFSVEKVLDNKVGFLKKIDERLNEDRDEPFSLILIDLDGFAKVNHAYGLPTADGLLDHLTRQIFESMRTLDQVARINADQFGMILPKTQAMGAKVVAERIRSVVKASAIAMGTVRPNCTASVGGLTIRPQDQRTNHIEIWDSLLELLKQAKNTGRNRIVWKKKVGDS
jgi:diguanylate cyclase (GGDEF)-like protein